MLSAVADIAAVYVVDDKTDKGTLVIVGLLVIAVGGITLVQRGRVTPLNEAQKQDGTPLVELAEDTY